MTRRARGVPLGKRRADDGSLEDDDVELAAMRVAYRLRKRGLTFETIADVLNELGFESRTGAPYTGLRARALAQAEEARGR